MPVIDIPNIDTSNEVHRAIIEQFNAQMNPDNKNIRPKTLDDILDGLLVFRATLINHFNEDLEKSRSDIRAEARAEAEQNLRDKLEMDVARAGNIPVSTPDELRTVIREVNAYDQLCKKYMSREKFLEYCKKEKISEAKADLIYISRAFDIETRRRLINENISLLA